jgi:hypothetical protein
VPGQIIKKIEPSAARAGIYPDGTKTIDTIASAAKNARRKSIGNIYMVPNFFASAKCPRLGRLLTVRFVRKFQVAA